MISRMCEATRAKMAMRKITCLLLVAVFILSLGGSASMRTNAGSPANDYAYVSDYVYADESGYTWFYATEDGTLDFGSLSLEEDLEEDAICITDFPIIDSDLWQDDGYATIMPLSGLSLTVQYPIVINSTTLRFIGHVINPENLQFSFIGFWTRNYYGGPTREVPGDLVGTTLNSGPLTGFTPGGRYGVRAVARVVGSTANRQSDARWPSTPLPTPTPPPGGGNTPTPPPGGGNTPPPGGGNTPTPPPGGGDTPTPSPPTPSPTPQAITFDPDIQAPWNMDWWTIGGAGGPTNAAVHAPGDWSAESSEGWLRVTGGAGGLFPFDAPDTLIDPLAHADAEVPISPLSLMVSGASGSQLTLSALPNDTGVARTATVTVRSGNLPAQTLHITQQPVVTDISGPRVIECFNRRGYVDFLGASFVETGICGSVARVPIWDFVPISGSVNVFAIRNDSIGLYFTETGGNVRLAAGNGSNNQRWVLARQSNGTYRIRSVSNGMYMHNGLGSLTLANHVHTIDQQWRIEHIWHITNDGHQQNWIGFWDGAITVRTEPIPERQAAGFNFESRMTSAQTAWSNVLGVTFLPVVENAHIRAYGGDRIEIARLINNEIPFDPTNERYAAMTGRLRGGGEPASPIGQIIAGGATRNVFRLNDSLVDGVMRIGVFSNTGAWYTLNLRNIHFATMAATHELGHALGYMGHSPNLSDIMTGHIPGLASPNRTLNPAEIEHLLQVYRRRPWR